MEQKNTAIELKIARSGGITVRFGSGDTGVEIRERRAKFAKKEQGPGHADMTHPACPGERGVEHILGAFAKPTIAAGHQVVSLSIARRYQAQHAEIELTPRDGEAIAARPQACKRVFAGAGIG